MKPLKLLYIEDQPAFAQLVEDSLALDTEQVWEFIWAKSVDQAQKICPPDKVDFLLLDLGLGETHGLETAERAMDYLRHSPTLVFTTMEERQLALGTLKLGAEDFMVKTDFEPEQLLRRLHMTRERFLLREKVQQQVEELSRQHLEMESILSSTEEGLALLDDAGKIHYANQLFLKAFNTETEKALLSWTQALEPNDQETFLQAFREGEQTWKTLPRIHLGSPGNPFRLRLRNIKEDGEKEVLVILQDLSHEERLRQIEGELREARETLGQQGKLGALVGDSPSMHQVYERMKVAGRSELSVLIQGESGTGKELAARAIHQLSPRSMGPFVAINCAALPEHLIESELFGHVKGAFTGATKDRQGLMLEAEGGSLFLDEIGEMPAPLQSKLLRVLQEKTLRRVGDSRETPVDIRIIAATNIDIQACIHDKSFREDLYYRISEFPITLPPLRERPEDLVPLAMHFLKQQDGRGGIPKTGFSMEAIDKMKGHSWPGNVRELRSTINRAALLEKGDEIGPDALDWPTSSSPSKETKSPGGEFLSLNSPLPLEEVERQLILRTLEKVDQNFTAAADLLKINRATLYRKIRKYENIQT